MWQLGIQQSHVSFKTVLPYEDKAPCIKREAFGIFQKNKCEQGEQKKFWVSKITADGDHSHEIKRHLPLGRKAITNLDSALKNRHHFADKGLSSQSYGFSSSHVWM